MPVNIPSNQIVTDRVNGKSRKRVQSVNNGKSKCQKHFGKQVDINTIVKKYDKTGVLASGVGVCDIKPNFTEFPTTEDMYNKMLRIADLNSYFESLPAEVKRELGNNVVNLIDYKNSLKPDVLTDSMRNEFKKALKMGLIERNTYQAYEEMYVKELERKEANKPQATTDTVKGVSGDN